MLQMKRGIILVKRELEILKGILKGLVATHRDTWVLLPRFHEVN